MFPFDLTNIAESVINPFKEQIIYRPRSGGTRTIYADIERIDRTQWAGIDNASAVSAVVTVRNDATNGITATEINTGGDKIDYAVRYGATATTQSITKVRETDDGWTTFEVS